MVREGRKIQLCRVSILSNGVEVVRATVLKVRVGGFDACRPMSPICRSTFLVRRMGIEEPPHGSSKFINSVTLRSVRGRFLSLGPAAIWFRANRPMIEESENSAVMRAALSADFTNGVASVIDFAKWTFINADLTVTLARAPVGDWILLNSETILGPDGAGIAVSRLGDAKGLFRPRDPVPGGRAAPLAIEKSQRGFGCQRPRD